MLKFLFRELNISDVKDDNSQEFYNAFLCVRHSSSALEELRNPCSKSYKVGVNTSQETEAQSSLVT